MRAVLLSLSLGFVLASCDSAGRSRPGTGPGGGTGSGGGSGGCMGQACYQMDCGSGAPRTSVTGKVTAPNGLDPVFDAEVYVPYNIPEFPPTVACETCNEPIGGTPIVSTRTAVDGTFTLSDVPVTTQVPVVIQKGRFRRIQYLTPTACTENKLSADQARLPRNQKEGTLPKMAVGVGDYDQIECVLRSIGIDESEFTAPGGAGAVHLYQNGGDPFGGFGGGGGASEFSELLSDSNKMAEYNLIFINCTSNLFDGLPNKTQATQNLYNYVNTGGRLYVTDWSYDYLEQVSQFAPYIFFDGGGNQSMPQPAHAAADAGDTSDIRAQVVDPTLKQWLSVVPPPTGGGPLISGNDVTITDLLGGWVLMDATATDQSTFPSQTWVHGNTNGADRPLTVTFDYNSCGKVLYSSYHTREPGGANALGGGGSFPSYCRSTAQTMIAQEKILEYLILQISACVGPIG